MAPGRAAPTESTRLLEPREDARRPEPSAAPSRPPPAPRSFLAQVPLCGAAWAAVYAVLDAPRPSPAPWLAKVRRIDFAGAAVLVLAVVSLLAGLDAGSNLGWRHAAAVAALAAAPGLFGLFVAVELRVAAHPLAPARVILDRGLLACFLANLFGAADALFFLPLYLQVVEAYGPAASGALLVPATVAAVVASLAGGCVIKRTGSFYAVTVLAYALEALGLVLLVLSVWFRATAAEVAALALASAGSESGLTTTLVALLTNAAAEDTAVVVACSYFFRSLGSSIGVSVSSALLQHLLRAQLAASQASGRLARLIEHRVRQNIDSIRELPPRVARVVRDSYHLATLGALAPTVVFAAAALLASLWVRARLVKG